MSVRSTPLGNVQIGGNTDQILFSVAPDQTAILRSLIVVNQTGGSTNVTIKHQRHGGVLAILYPTTALAGGARLAFDHWMALGPEDELICRSSAGTGIWFSAYGAVLDGVAL